MMLTDDGHTGCKLCICITGHINNYGNAYGNENTIVRYYKHYWGLSIHFHLRVKFNLHDVKHKALYAAFCLQDCSCKELYLWCRSKEQMKKRQIRLWVNVTIPDGSILFSLRRREPLCVVLLASSVQWEPLEPIVCPSSQLCYHGNKAERGRAEHRKFIFSSLTNSLTRLVWLHS